MAGFEPKGAGVRAVTPSLTYSSVPAMEQSR